MENRKFKAGIYQHLRFSRDGFFWRTLDIVTYVINLITHIFENVILPSGLSDLSPGIRYRVLVLGYRTLSRSLFKL